MSKTCALKTGERGCAKCGAEKPHNLYAQGNTAAQYARYVAKRLPELEPGETPLAMGQVLDVPEDAPLIGWRLWGVVRGKQGPRLVAPYRPDPDYAPAVWVPGDNTSSTEACWADACSKPKRHPSPNCWCGFRAMTSKSALSAFVADQGERFPDTIAVATVEMWGRVAGPAPGDDWQRTIRGRFARIEDSLYLMGEPEDGVAVELAEHYGVDVVVMA